MQKCDIIIPIYNAYDCLVPCIDSVLKNTNFEKAHLILIDDKSPDERVLPLLEKYEEENPDKITVLKNEKNLGFVGTVNKGMKHSKHDVLLLNSDTEVTKDWLDKIRDCAYGDEYIATVTPLSNNATLASVPKIFEENKLPRGYSLAEMAQLVEDSSMGLFPEIPTGHGFCMYIKREALDVVGYFDEKNFGKGYGEENDFSFRCLKYGYRNVLCDNTYVLHKESQSFLDKKKYHEGELKEKHPVAKDRLDFWNRIREIEKIGANIEISLGVKEKRPNILILMHDFSNIEHNLGGTTLHVVDVINGLRDRYNFHVLAPEGGFYKVHSFFKEYDLVTSVYEKPIVVEDVQFYSNEYRRMVSSIIDDYKISFVHIHHMIGHCFDVMNVCKDHKIKYAVSLHDYYLIEATTGVIEKEVGSTQNDVVDVAGWRKNAAALLERAAEVFSPSEYVKDVFERFYNPNNITVIEHGMDLEKKQKTWKKANVKNIAFVGVMATHKGAEILDELIRIAPKDLRIHLFGVKYTNVARKNIFINHGAYRREDLPKLFEENKIDLACIFSLWPETYSYTATEVVACGVPVVAFDLGAIQERIEKHKIGFTIPYTKDAKVILNSILEILDDEKQYEQAIDAVGAYKIRTIAEMNKDYERFYKKYIKVGELDTGVLRNNMLRYQMVMNTLKKNVGADERTIKKEMIKRYLNKTKIGRMVLNQDTRVGKMARSFKLAKRLK